MHCIYLKFMRLYVCVCMRVCVCVVRSNWYIFICLSSGPMPWCINSEIYSNSFRSTGNSLSTAANWMSNIIMSATFLTLIKLFSKQGVFVVYSALTIAFLCFFYKYLPETKNLPLEEITYAFHDDNWGQKVFFNGNSDGWTRTRSSENSDADGFDSNMESNAVSEALLKTKYFEDSGSSRHNSSYSGGGLSGHTSGELSGLLSGEISYSTQHDDHGRTSIVEF